MGDMLAVRASIRIHGVNTTSFIADKPVLEKIIANITNSSSSEVQIIIRYPPKVHAGSILRWHYIEVLPRDTSHEMYVVSKMGNGASLRDEILLSLQTQTTANNFTIMRLNNGYRKIPYGELSNVY